MQKKNSPKTIRNLGTSPQERSSKRLRNIGLKGYQIINLAPTPTCLSQALVPKRSGPDVPIRFICTLTSPCSTLVPPHPTELSPF